MKQKKHILNIYKTYTEHIQTIYNTSTNLSLSLCIYIYIYLLMNLTYIEYMYDKKTYSKRI